MSLRMHHVCAVGSAEDDAEQRQNLSGQLRSVRDDVELLKAFLRNVEISRNAGGSGQIIPLPPFRKGGDSI